MYEGIVEKINFFSPNKIKKKWLRAAHDVEYIQKLENLSLSKSEIRKTGFPLTRELVNREFIITQGTLDCVDYALKYGAAADEIDGFVVGKHELFPIPQDEIDLAGGNWLQNPGY